MKEINYKISEQNVSLPRVSMHVKVSGPIDGKPLLFVHGNVSSSIFWKHILGELDGRFRKVAMDLRGFGHSEKKPIRAELGLKDFSDDIHELVHKSGLLDTTEKINLVGWSMGGGIIMQYAIDHPDKVDSLILVSPISPFGFGGTADINGRPCWPDYAGSGGGIVNPDFLKRLEAKDKSDESDVSPRRILNTNYFNPPFRVDSETEDEYVEAMLQTAVGDDFYPGDSVPSPNWPGVAPGTRGLANAFSPKYFNLNEFATIDPKPPVLWIRGSQDKIVSDTSLLDIGFLGKLGIVPGWPGEDVYPPQPMVSQMRKVLEDYASAGGKFQEEVFEGCGHSPHIEAKDKFIDLITSFLVSL